MEEIKIKERKSKKLTKRIPKFIIYIIVIIIVILIFNSGMLFNTFLTSQTKTTKLGFEDIGELITQTGFLTVIKDTEEHKEFFNLFKIPFTESRQIFSYDIEVDASIDFSKVTPKEFDDKHKEIKIEMPHAKIYKATIDNESLKVYLDKESLFTRIDLKEHNELVEEMKEQGINDAKENGILDLAEKNAEKLISNFINKNEKYKDYKPVFEYIDENR